MGIRPKTRKIANEILDRFSAMTLPQILAFQASHLERKDVAIREKSFGIWQRLGWSEYLDHVRKTACGLKTLGLERHDNVVMVLDNHPEWLFSQLGAQAMGAVTLNLFTSAVAPELASAMERVRAKIAVVQDQEQVDKLLDQISTLPHLKAIVFVDPTGMRGYGDKRLLVSFRELLDIGAKRETKHPGLFAEEMAKGKPDETAHMILTSGTTGLSKLAMLSHRNYTSMGRKWIESAPVAVGGNWLSMTPPAWIVDQMWAFGVALEGGMTMNFPETPETVMQDFREIGPDLLISSSRFWEDLASRIRVKIDDAGLVQKLCFSVAERIGLACVERGRGRVPPAAYIAHVIARLLVFDHLLDRVGCSRLLAAYTGGHPISPDVIRFFRACGLNLKQCYGMTETCGIFQVQPDDEVKPETVGKSLPKTTVKISDDQEVMVLSESVFQGYYNDFDETKNAFEDGWFKTGDAGYFDDDGHLVIIGRKQDIIRDKEGNAFSPDFIETRLKFSLYIKEAVVFGEGRPFITALINIDQGNTGNWAEARMIPYTTYTDLTQRPEVERLILDEVRKVNAQLPRPMQVRRFILLYKLLDADDEELTRTGKVRRRFIYGLYLNLIEAMYQGLPEVQVKGKIRYRDGTVGVIETVSRIITVDRE